MSHVLKPIQKKFFLENNKIYVWGAIKVTKGIFSYGKNHCFIWIMFKIYIVQYFGWLTCEDLYT